MFSYFCTFALLAGELQAHLTDHSIFTSTARSSGANRLVKPRDGKCGHCHTCSNPQLKKSCMTLRKGEPLPNRKKKKNREDSLIVERGEPTPAVSVEPSVGCVHQQGGDYQCEYPIKNKVLFHTYKLMEPKGFITRAYFPIR